MSYGWSQRARVALAAAALVALATPSQAKHASKHRQHPVAAAPQKSHGPRAAGKIKLQGLASVAVAPGSTLADAGAGLTGGKTMLTARAQSPASTYLGTPGVSMATRPLAPSTAPGTQARAGTLGATQTRAAAGALLPSVAATDARQDASGAGGPLGPSSAKVDSATSRLPR